MSFTQAKLISKTGTIELGGKRTYVLTYQTTSDSSSGGAIGARLASGMPRIGDQYADGDDEDDRAYCTQKQVSSDTERDYTSWTVVATFSTLTREEKKRRDHPLDRPAEIEFGFDTYEEVVITDINGEVVANSAKQPFDPPVLRDHHRSRLRIVRNEETFDGTIAQSYMNTINNATFLGGPPKTVKCSSISATRVVEEFSEDETTTEEVIYWKVTYEFQYNEKEWVKRILDAGRYELTEDANNVETWTPIVDDNNEPVADPVFLDGAGEQSETPVFLPFDVYEYRNFNGLNFVFD